MRRTRLALTVAALASAMLVACGGDDAAGDADAADASATSTGGGSAAATSAASGLPAGAGADFPVAIADGWIIDIHGRAGLNINNQVQVLYPLEDFDRVVAFYEQWTASQPDSYNRGETANSVLFNLDAPIHRIAISNNYEEQDQQYTVLQITVSGG